MEFKSLITKFAASLGIHDLAFDESGVTRLSADDVTIAFMEVHERHSLLMWSNVATPSPENREELYKVLLEASFMGQGTRGGTFSLDHGAIYLHRTEALVNLDVEALLKIVEDFLGLVGTYRRIIETFHVHASAKTEVDSPRMLHGGLHPHGYLHV